MNLKNKIYRFLRKKTNTMSCGMGPEECMWDISMHRKGWNTWKVTDNIEKTARGLKHYEDKN